MHHTDNSAINTAKRRDVIHLPSPFRGTQELWAFLAMAGFVGGTLLSLVGAIVLAVDWLLVPIRLSGLHSAIRTTGTLMLVSIAPLLLFAGYCLDRLDRNPHA